MTTGWFAMFMMHSTAGALCSRRILKAGLLVLLFFLLACTKEKESTLVDYRYKYDSLLQENRKISLQIDSLKLYVRFNESQNKQVQQERKTVYYQTPVRSDPALRNWFDEYLRTRADSIKF